MAADALPPFLHRLVQATNAHQIDALVDCFAADYRNATPVHPARGFDGAGQVRANWSQIFRFVPDVRATVSRWAVAGEDIWSEWEMSGTRLDGSPHLMRGVVIFTVPDQVATRSSFYLDSVDEEDTAAVAEVVSRQVHAVAAGQPAT